MEFDKSKVYTALNADELPIGSKCIFADNLTDLKKYVEHNYNIYTLFKIMGEDWFDRFAVTSFPVNCDTITLSNQFVIESYTQGSFAQYKEGVGTLRASGGDFGGGSEAIIKDGYKLRRLTPLECERLQGLPDNYTRIEWRGKPQNECPDSHRYRAIGNSMAVPVMRWIGERIKKIEGKLK